MDVSLKGKYAFGKDSLLFAQLPIILNEGEIQEEGNQLLLRLFVLFRLRRSIVESDAHLTAVPPDYIREFHHQKGDLRKALSGPSAEVIEDSAFAFLLSVRLKLKQKIGIVLYFEEMNEEGQRELFLRLRGEYRQSREDRILGRNGFDDLHFFDVGVPFGVSFDVGDSFEQRFGLYF